MQNNTTTLSYDLDFKELDECLQNLEELQKSLEKDVKPARKLDITKNKPIMEVKDPVISERTKKKIRFANNCTKLNDSRSTDLDDLLNRLKLNDLNRPNIESPLPIRVKRGRSCISASTGGCIRQPLLSVRSLKNDETTNGHDTNSNVNSSCGSSHKIISLGLSSKYVEQYSSLPRIIMNYDNQSLSVLYKSSSQTNLSHQDAEYKLPLTVYQPNRTTKTIMIDETTTTADICQLLTARNYLMPNIRFSLVEKIPLLKIERCFEDDECPVACLLSYKNDNRTSLIFFEDREDKYGLFVEPQKWLGSSFEDSMNKSSIKEIFCGPVPQLPTFRSHLFYRKFQKKSWHRRLCILRNSGLYAFEKSKDIDSSNLQLIISLHPSLYLYTTTGGWCNMKTPTPYGFCLKTYGEQNPKYICYFCALSESGLRYWSSLFRIALKGKILFENYQNQLEFVSETLHSFQEQNREFLNSQLSRSIGCVTGRLDLQTDL